MNKLIAKLISPVKCTKQSLPLIYVRLHVCRSVSAWGRIFVRAYVYTVLQWNWQNSVIKWTISLPENHTSPSTHLNGSHIRSIGVYIPKPGEYKLKTHTCTYIYIYVHAYIHTYVPRKKRTEFRLKIDHYPGYQPYITSMQLIKTQYTFPCSTGHTPGVNQVHISTDHTVGVLGFTFQKKGKTNSIHIYVYIYIHEHKYAYTYICIRVYVRVCVYIYIYTYIYIHIYISFERNGQSFALKLTITQA